MTEEVDRGRPKMVGAGIGELHDLIACHNGDSDNSSRVLGGESARRGFRAPSCQYAMPMLCANVFVSLTLSSM